MEFEHRFDKVAEIMTRRGITTEEIAMIARVFQHAFAYHEMNSKQIVEAVKHGK